MASGSAETGANWFSCLEEPRRLATRTASKGIGPKMKNNTTAAEAVAQIHDGAIVLIGGFGGSGAPIELVHALIDHGAKDLVVVNNNAGTGDVGLAALIRRRRVRKDDLLVSAFVRSARVP